MEANEYDLMYQVESDLWWYRALRQLVGKYLAKYVPIQGRVADAGCGTGINSLVWQQAGYKVTAFDLSPQAVKYSLQRGVKSVKTGSVTQMPVTAKSADAICILDVLIMLTPEEVSQAIAETRRVLKPGGVAIIQVAAFEWLRSSHDVVCHVRKRYTRQELEAFFDPRDWKIIKSSYRICLLFPLVAGVKLLKKWLDRGKPAVSGDLEVPPSVLNQILYVVQWIENQLSFNISWPWGSSVFLVVQKR
jgi:ubiquinone/menaquinone biosynthesis C-methylase UbiE